VLEVLEQPGKGRRVKDARLGVTVLRPEVDQRVTRHHDRDLVLVDVLKLGECLGVGEARPVHDDLARVEILMDRRAGTATAARTVEAQPSSHDQRPFAGSRSPQHHQVARPGLWGSTTFARKIEPSKRAPEKNRENSIARPNLASLTSRS